MRRTLQFVPYLILAAALTLLYRELSHLRWAELNGTLFDYGWECFVLGLSLLAANYLVWGGYDWTSLRQLGIRLSYVQILRTTSVAFPITNLLGYSVITGFPTRLRRYETFGVSVGNITKLTLFNITTWWAGFLTLCGGALAFSPDGELLGSSEAGVRILGLSMLSLVGVYLAVAWRFGEREFFWRKWHWHFPSASSLLFKILVSSIDNLIVGLTLYVFLPSVHSMPVARFMAFFLTAYLTAFLSFVPAGWGVLEGLLLILLRPYASDAEILTGLVLFRVFHYLLPAGLTICFMGADRLLRGISRESSSNWRARFSIRL